MKHLPYLTTALAALLMLSAPAAQAGPGINRPALDGRQAALSLSDGRQIGGTTAEEPQGTTTRGLALDHRRRVATPDLAGLSVGHERFPRDDWEVRPIEQRWPDAGRNWLVQQ
jgi:hypothetical protein